MARVGDLADERAGSTDELVKLGRSILANPTDPMKVRLAGGEAGMTPDWLDACEGLAAASAMAPPAADTSPEAVQVDREKWI